MGKDFSAELFGSPNASPSSGAGKDFSTELFGPAKRTTGEAFTDVGAGLVSGIGSLVQLPSQLYGLATGDFSDTGLMSLGKGIEKQGEEWKSRALKEKEIAQESKQILSDMIMGKMVTLVDVDTEKYGRLLAYVYIDDICLNTYMLLHGHTVEYNGGKKNTDEWK